MFKKKRPDLLQDLLRRCDDIIKISQDKSQEHNQIAENWGKTHIILGLSTILSSSVSAVFAFSSFQKLVIASSLFSTILASCITFFNPSQREIKRRNYSGKFLSLIQGAEGIKISLKVKYLSDNDMIESVENLSKKLEELLIETSGNN